ncbi:MAG: hypothetical protein J6Q85_06865 [Clostridia bacterium]|nr:hypothetical protein [Clostridia bacterium]
MGMYSYSSSLSNNTSQLESLLTGLSVFGVIASIIAIILCAVIADKKGRSVGGWIFGALCLGWIGVIILCCLSDLNTNYYKKSGIGTTQPGVFPKARTIEPKKVGSYRCENCGEMIDTEQCPWCGTRKNK